MADTLSRLRSNGGKTENVPREEVFQTRVTTELLQSFEKCDASADKRVSDVRYQAIQKATSQDQELMELASVNMKGWPDQRLMTPTSAKPH